MVDLPVLLGAPPCLAVVRPCPADDRLRTRNRLPTRGDEHPSAVAHRRRALAHLVASVAKSFLVNRRPRTSKTHDRKLGLVSHPAYGVFHPGPPCLPIGRRCPDEANVGPFRAALAA